MSGDLVERVARAICEVFESEDAHPQNWNEEARATIRALLEDGNE